MVYPKQRNTKYHHASTLGTRLLEKDKIKTIFFLVLLFQIFAKTK